jgi:hypothetical protein
MLNEKIIEQELKNNTDELFVYLKGIDNSLALLHPEDNSWSILDCCEHIYILEQAVNTLFKGKTEKTDRNPTEKIEKIKYRFNDYNQKLSAGDPIKPKGIFKDKEKVIQAIVSNRSQLLELPQNGSWSDLCLGFSHAIFGYLTRIEWLYFCIFHTERHLHQMKSIEERIINPEINKEKEKNISIDTIE